MKKQRNQWILGTFDSSDQILVSHQMAFFGGGTKTPNVHRFSLPFLVICTPRKINGWNLKITHTIKIRKKSSEPNHHDFRFDSLIFRFRVGHFPPPQRSLPPYRFGDPPEAPVHRALQSASRRCLDVSQIWCPGCCFFRKKIR